MKEYRRFGGERRVWYDSSEIDRIMTDELTTAALLPDASREDVTVDVEAFVERHLRLAFDQYAELDADVLGVTRFASGKKPRIEINRDLTGSALDCEDDTPGMLGRWRATVAHEVGHVLLHRYLYEVDDRQPRLFSAAALASPPSSSLMRCLKRDVGYTGGSDWREFQANLAIGALLMPKPVIDIVVAAEVNRLQLPPQRLQPDSSAVEEVVRAVARRFTVSRTAARIRLEGSRAISQRGQASL